MNKNDLLLAALQAELTKPQKPTEPKEPKNLFFGYRSVPVPACPYCGLEHFKDEEEKPTEKHIINCTYRPMGKKPRYSGTYRGQAHMATLSFQVRQSKMVPDKDKKTGEPIKKFFASLATKQHEVVHWVWNGQDWVPWHEFC